MKLILSSKDFHNENSARAIYDGIGMPVGECRVLYFPNEKATLDKILGSVYYERLAAFGFMKENISVFNYYAPDAFFHKEYDAIYISGGNTFGTLKRIRECKADALIRELVAQGCIYIGGSAGAHIPSADLTHVLRYDRDLCGLEDLSGLGLFDGILICHFTEERRAHLEELKTTSPYPVTALTDEEFIVIDQFSKYDSEDLP